MLILMLKLVIMLELMLMIMLMLVLMLVLMRVLMLVLMLMLKPMLILMLMRRLVGATSCPPERLAVYKLELETFWDEHNFPKQYPQVDNIPHSIATGEHKHDIHLRPQSGNKS